MTTGRIQRQIERLLDEAEQASEHEDWETVLNRSTRVLTFDPVNGDALTFLAAAKRALDGTTPTPAQTKSHSPQSAPPSPTPSHPTSFASGRYEVKRFLGEGGKKKVYLAHDTLLDRDVAFALIKTDGLDDAGRTRIIREAQAMGRLGSHPHIVTVFDLGQEGDQPYMVTELMGGGDVDGLIEKASEHRMPLEQALDIAKAVCQGLEFAHSRGIVHRDLKPGNVWLTGGGVAKIGDFGLAVAVDRSRLTQAGMMVGTVSYMPPEQALGGQVDARSDLYSLGAMIYEMVCGRPPFVGDESVAIIGQHINTPPVAPSWHNPNCPKALEEIVLRLLAKRPEDRPQSAQDVLETLNAIDLSLSPTTETERAEANPLERLARGTFVGRAQEMAQGRSLVEDAFS
ncbi:MAG: serine/threonine protein kinase, partial [Chloroflexi bacterium]|nr:serine/threonine protein kinase [Chloroflexota bacterium]